MKIINELVEPTKQLNSKKTEPSQWNSCVLNLPVVCPLRTSSKSSLNQSINISNVKSFHQNWKPPPPPPTPPPRTMTEINPKHRYPPHQCGSSIHPNRNPDNKPIHQSLSKISSQIIHFRNNSTNQKADQIWPQCIINQDRRRRGNQNQFNNKEKLLIQPIKKKKIKKKLMQTC